MFSPVLQSVHKRSEKGTNSKVERPSGSIRLLRMQKMMTNGNVAESSQD